MSRMQKVNSLVREYLGNIINELIEFPKGSLVTIKDVSIASDLRSGKVYVSVFPFSQRHRCLKLLEKKKFLLQRELGKKIKFKYVPRLTIVLDTSEENVAKIEKLFE